jgi:hypothetical protein
MYISIPTYKTETGLWTHTDFETRDDFKAFVWSKFIKPGDLKLYNTHSWRQEALKYEKQKYYCNAPFKSRDFITYWETEKEKSTKGVIIDDFYLTRYYYFWINFLPINDKVVNKLQFPKIWDSQYYFFLYEMLCELEYKYSVIVKKRQWGSTFQHLSILINDIWFEEGYINKVAASDDDYIAADWAVLEEYRTFLNTNTQWYRPFTPDQQYNWQQKWEVKAAGKKGFKGNKSILKGLNLKTNPTKGVGGKNNKFYYEEAGITKTMRSTYNYIDPALKLGALTTGIFMAGGSVGELDQCEDLKKMAFDPGAFNILPIENTFEDNPEVPKVCFFVPEFWSMPPYIDMDGNSLVEEAKAWCIEEREKLKEASSPEDHRMYISQHPFDLSEAFAWRKESIFPQAKILKQQERINIEKLTGDAVILDYAANSDKVYHKLSDLLPIRKFPLNEKESKHGCIEVWEYPEQNPEWMTYFAGVDPIATDKTTTSPSLFSIYIFKNLVERTYEEKGIRKTKVEGYKPVAAYTGRYDDLRTVNTIAESLIVWYNALTAVENNVPSFINHMQQRGLQKYLATKDQLSFISELKTNTNVYSPYGFRTNETIKTYFIDIVSDYLNEELDISLIPGTDKVLKKTFGVERIKDIALLEELRQYHHDLNTDRFIAFAAGLALMKSFRKYSLGVKKIDETKTPDEHIEKIEHMGKSFFKHYGTIVYTQDNEGGVTKINRSFFKHHK